VHGGFTVFPTAVLRSYAVLQWAGLLLIVDHWAAGGVARVADKQHALDAVKKFEAAYGAKFGKAVAKITDDLDELLAFYDYPAEHWAHLRTTNPIEYHLRDRPTPPAGHQGPRLPRRRRRDGLQTHRVRPGPLARGQRTPPGRPGPRWREVRERQTRRTTRRIGR